MKGWIGATFSCGSCGAKRDATTEAEYVSAYRAHKDAHAIADRLNSIERSGMAPILRVLLDDVQLSRDLLALLERPNP